MWEKWYAIFAAKSRLSKKKQREEAHWTSNNQTIRSGTATENYIVTRAGS